MEATEWKLVPSRLRANCIFNYNVPPAPIQPQEPTRLPLYLGDPVVILAENGEWYFGHKIANEKEKGVFPKSYVHVSSSNTQQEPLVEEINSSLKEWHEIMLQKYVEVQKASASQVHIIRGIMRDVTSMRSSLATGKLTEEEAKETRQKVVSKTDFLNSRLGLDLVVRDTNGNVLRPER